MKKLIYLCTNCHEVFDELVEDCISCPKCGSKTNIEIYEYDVSDISKLKADSIMTRLPSRLQDWYNENYRKLIVDFLTMESKVQGKNPYIHYQLTSIESNCDYLIKKLNEWKDKRLSTKDNRIVFMSGNPGCLVSEEDWGYIIDTTMSIRNDTDIMLRVVERYMEDNEDNIAWNRLEDYITESLKELVSIYNFFKNGVDIGLRL